LELDGIFTFRGASFPGAPSQDPAELGRLEGELMVQLAQQLRAAGVTIREVSVGSTPTGSAAALVAGVTEVRPGTYIFFDRMTTLAGVNEYSEIALSILATVVSRPSADTAIIDAGSKTFCGDIVPAQIGLNGYGVTVDGERGFVSKMSEEHAFVQLAPGFDPAVGEKLLFYPNHVCTSVNLSNELYIIEDGRLSAIWTIAARGLRQ
jgi:D-serine deaminase-like pyridoxal phosphate-dependent protein